MNAEVIRSRIRSLKPLSPELALIEKVQDARNRRVAAIMRGASDFEVLLLEIAEICVLRALEQSPPLKTAGVTE